MSLDAIAADSTGGAARPSLRFLCGSPTLTSFESVSAASIVGCLPRSSFDTERDRRVDLGGATGGDEAGDQDDSGHDERSAEQRCDGQRRHIEENALHRSSGEPRAEQAKRAAGSEEAQA